MYQKDLSNGLDEKCPYFYSPIFPSFRPKNATETFPGARLEAKCRFPIVQEMIAQLEEELCQSHKRIEELKDSEINKEITKMFVNTFRMQKLNKLYRLKKKYLKLLPDVRLELEESKPIVSGQIPQEEINRAREHPIEEIAQRYMQIHRVGDKYKARCPFHDDKTPSFYLYPATNTYHCFGCQAHGDGIDMVRKLDNCSFGEALNKLR